MLAALVDEIERLTRQVQGSPSRSPDAIRGRLAEQVAKLLDANSAFDPVRLHQEAILLATRSDVEEELQRLTAHVASARALLSEGTPAGRKLDFLAQEFNREANTLTLEGHRYGRVARGAGSEDRHRSIARAGAEH